MFELADAHYVYCICNVRKVNQTLNNRVSVISYYAANLDSLYQGLQRTKSRNSQTNFVQLLDDVCLPKLANTRTSWPVCSPKAIFCGFTSSLYVLGCDEIASPAQMFAISENWRSLVAAKNGCSLQTHVLMYKCTYLLLQQNFQLRFAKHNYLYFRLMQ